MQSLRASRWGSGSQGLWLSASGREVVKVLSGVLNTARHGQEKNLWVNKPVCLCLPLYVSLTHHKSVNPFEKCERYIFITKCCRSSFIALNNSYSLVIVSFFSAMVIALRKRMKVKTDIPHAVNLANIYPFVSSVLL